jgi:ubiquinone/menaquinone biosynthesis C-methylase UbiE
MTDRTKSAYDCFAEFYDVDDNPLIALEHAHVVQMLNPRNGEKIPDAACGTGKYVADILARGAKVTGFDFSEGMLSIARSKFPQARLELADLNNRLPYVDNEFSKVNCSQALKHIAKLGAPLSEFARVVKANGTVVFSVTHPHMTWDGFEMTSSPKFVIGKETDVFHHSFDDYRSAIVNAGLALDRVKNIRIDGSVRSMLTPKSYKLVKGRPMVAVFVCLKV